MPKALTETLRTPLDLLAGIFFILGSFKAFALAVIPSVIGAATFIATLSYAVGARAAIAATLWTPEAAWLRVAFEWAVSFMLLVPSVLVSVIVAIGLGGIFIEFLVELMLEDEGIPVPQAPNYTTLARHVLVSLGHSLMRSLVIGSLAMASLLLGFIPLLLPVAFALNVVILGANLIDLPLSILRVPFRRRLAYQTGSFSVVAPLGIVFTLIAMVPFLGMFLLAPGHFAAIRKLKRAGILPLLPQSDAP